MPRLIGKPSQAPMYVGLAFLVAVIGASVLEYSGDLNLVPGFGEQPTDRQPAGLSSQQYPLQP
ncbi:hypothetical protein [Chamaesiphon sp.]|uniref:hypothetical protein n=1 Tax=Chamaesiphon sp. TaxID=2814140 RepID=UPI0035941883